MDVTDFENMKEQRDAALRACVSLAQEARSLRERLERIAPSESGFPASDEGAGESALEAHQNGVNTNFLVNTGVRRS